MQAPDNMTRAELLRAIGKASAESSAVTDALIAAGRGNERPAEMRVKSDPLSLRYIAAADRCAALSYERSRRMQWQGNEHRIKRHA